MGEIGGHGGIQIIGPVMLKETNHVERDFYARIFPCPPPHIPPDVNIPNGLNPHKLIRHNDCDDHDDLREQVPTYYGTQKETGKIILENMAYGLESPRFMDVKIGARTVSQSELMAAGKGASDAWKKSRG